jgi:hypothetical protein
MKEILLLPSLLETKLHKTLALAGGKSQSQRCK